MASTYRDEYVTGIEMDAIQLRERLAKANERVEELEEQLISACDALAKARDKVVTLERKNSFIKRSANRQLRKEQENV